nr:cytochrome c oxidase subunit 2 [Actornithophilus hoplopteri]
MNHFMFNLQDAVWFLMEQLVFFHDHVMMMMLFILSFVSYIFFFMITNKLINLSLLFNEEVEILWTLFPGVVLLFIALPSLKILYLSDEVVKPELTIKTIGHQWYWSYEYSDFDKIEFDSYMKSNSESDDFRLLDVDNRVIIPIMNKIRMVITSSDVIHSWTVPSMGAKMDANPGRLNQLVLQSNQIGTFFGQCSEICGPLHSFMPICVDVVPLPNFFNWLESKTN